MSAKRGPEKGAPRRSFGRLRKERSGRWSAAYIGPDGELYRAASTFSAKDDATAWLAKERRLIDLDDWTRPDRRNAKVARTEMLKDYSTRWLEERRTDGRPLKARTRAEYERLLEKVILPTLGKYRLSAIDEKDVSAWYESLDASKPTQRARAYALLKTILTTAVEERRIPDNPCTVRGAGRSKRAKQIQPATLEELEIIAANMPEDRRLAVMLAAWCALRYGEVTELRRKDIDIKNQKLRIRRGVVIIDSQRIVDTPKTEAGIRTIAIPPHLLPMIQNHLGLYAQPGRDGLLFYGRDGRQLAETTFMGKPARTREIKGRLVNESASGFMKARAAAGRDDLRFHDLRHTGAVLAAQAGATLADLMNRLGHTTPAAAMLYQHAAEERDAEIAAKLSAMASLTTTQETP